MGGEGVPLFQHFFSFFGRAVHHLRHFLGSGVQINFREGEVENYLVGRVLGEGGKPIFRRLYIPRVLCSELL